ncbi:response regulator [Lichenicoccus roseus]|uniref:Response regulator n=1 Tax=Lichenicoccus roseus TaxID=2683649 RepID=A0A5R9J848_9PROT|nr:response regulator [Lichenicoccus roseus]TLU73794.1 response regulator [Lichenicoccus roseus]
MCDLLLLDDDPLVRTTLGEALRDAGIGVVEAASEAEALAALRDEQVKPRVLVTDLDLRTGRNGFVVAAIAQALLPDIAVVYITGRADVLEDRTLRPGERMLAKPFRPSQLIDLLRELDTAPASPPAGS